MNVTNLTIWKTASSKTSKMTKSENENASSGNVLVHVDPPIRSFADKDTAPVT